MSSLHLENLAKSYGGVHAVAGVSFEVPPGRITGLIGPNGAGKSTIVNLIAGYTRATTGHIRFGDQDLTRTSPHKIARTGIARTFQNIRLLSHASVFDNVMIGFHRHEKASLLSALLWQKAYRDEDKHLRERARELLTQFGMARYADQAAGDLAYGHQRRVEMMRALASEPQVLLLDEPVAGMNDVEAAGLGRIFADIARGGVGVLLIEHNIRFVTRLCEEIHVLDAGRLIASGSAKTVMRDPTVVAAYLGV